MAPGRFYELSACVAASGERDARPALVLGPGAEDAPVALLDRDVVDARLAAAHVALVVELPLLVAVAAPPLARGVAALVLEAHGDPVGGERPQVLAQRVVLLALPLAREERDDRLAAGEELVAVAPLRVLGVRGRDPLGLARVPRVLGGLDLLAGGLLGERRDGRSHGAILSGARDGCHPRVRARSTLANATTPHTVTATHVHARANAVMPTAWLIGAYMPTGKTVLQRRARGRTPDRRARGPGGGGGGGGPPPPPRGPPPPPPPPRPPRAGGRAGAPRGGA